MNATCPAGAKARAACLSQTAVNEMRMMKFKEMTERLSLGSSFSLHSHALSARARYLVLSKPRYRTFGSGLLPFKIQNQKFNILGF